MENQTIKELTSFIKNSPTAFHAENQSGIFLQKKDFRS